MGGTLAGNTLPGDTLLGDTLLGDKLLADSFSGDLSPAEKYFIDRFEQCRGRAFSQLRILRSIIVCIL